MWTPGNFSSCKKLPTISESPTFVHDRKLTNPAGIRILRHVGANVADGPDAFDRGLHVAVGDDVSTLVVVDVDLEQLGVGDETDEDENPADLQLLRLPVLLVANGLHLLAADDLLDVSVEDELDLWVRLRAVDEDRLRPQPSPPVDDVDLRRVAGQKVAFLDRGVAASDDGERLAFEKGPVTHSAVADAAAPELLLARYLQVAGQAARGHDQRRGS